MRRRLTDRVLRHAHGAPFALGFFTGDYEGLASAGSDFGAFFGQTHGTDPGSIFFDRVGSP